MKIYSLILTFLFLCFTWCFFIPRILKFFEFLMYLIQNLLTKKENNSIGLAMFNSNEILKKKYGENGIIDKWKIYFFLLVLKFLKEIFIYFVTNYHYINMYLDVKQCFILIEFFSINIVFFFLNTTLYIVWGKIKFLLKKSTASIKIRIFFLFLEFSCLTIAFLLLILFLINFFSVIFYSFDFFFMSDIDITEI